MYENNKPFLVKILKVLFKQWTKTYDIERIEEDIFDESGDVWSFMEKFTDILGVDLLILIQFPFCTMYSS